MSCSASRRRCRCRCRFVRERALLDEASLLKDAREEGRKAGRAEGEQAALRRTAANLIRQSSLNDAAIAAATGLAPSQVTVLRSTLT